MTMQSEAMLELMSRKCGMIFEFKKMDQAEAFAAAVKSRFDLEGRVFDDAEAAARSHFFPWVQTPPVVHVDRPRWKPCDDALQEERDRAFQIERRIEELAVQLGGTFVGT
jgi:hypothetical protein